MTPPLRIVTRSLSHLTCRIKNSEDCDVDTVTGNLMPPVEFPFTKSNYDEAGRITSEMRIQSCILKSSVRKAKKKLKKETRTAAKVDAVEREPSPELPLDPNQVLTPSHLRPATESDLEGIADIYNNEVKHSYKVMDVEPVSLEKFRQLYLACRNEKMPFVVAFEGWYNSHKTPNPKLIGFALVDAVARGLTGSYATHSRHGGKITVIVHPDFRRKKIGTALLDIILSSCSQRYFTRQGYQFENPTQDMTLMRPMYNSRTWRYLEMEVIIRTGESEEETRKGDEFQWIWNFLEARFLLILVHYDEKVLRDPRTNPKQGLDRLTFRHICRNLKED
ncbi:hypothetical protein F5X99DRAFT_149751 [Biscogniauxia marginata]|nr:hypothetical protein F5X99DRAFT_149751 [Biscogniauxia marginata]